MNKRYVVSTIIATCSICLMVGGIALAQSGDTFELGQYTVDSGGGSSSGGAFVVKGTAGQADAGTASGGTFTINSGFWHSREAYIVYLPVVLR